jgi:hypothetical protein
MTDGLPTPRTTLRASYVAVLVWTVPRSQVLSPCRQQVWQPSSSRQHGRQLQLASLSAGWKDQHCCAASARGNMPHIQISDPAPRLSRANEGTE